MNDTVTGKKERLTELELIEGNYYKMDFFVSGSLVLFTIWVFYAKETLGWTVFLGLLAVLFCIRGIMNFKKRPDGKEKPGVKG
ncbi:MAG: hypothetical protein U9P14_10125 [Gemmatimonadota bacterium]|nr:hypothetical protein [Gemmatimonadota bacterium]